MSLIPGQVIKGRYRVIALLGYGGMGAVYEAMDLTLNIRCALKEMVPYPGTQGTAVPELREQFRQEARLLAELRYPGLPRVTDHFEEDGNAYLVMDFIYGKRLDAIITQEGGLPEGEVLAWARQLMEALSYCHEQGVIHRDVKPQNVIVTPQGRATLVDFGLAKLVDPEDPRTRTVMRGLGTPEYAPPEQYDKKRGQTDARTDIYSLGATLYHALVGEAPPTVTERVVDPEGLVPPRQRRDDISEATDHVLMKALALQPSQRFQSITQMHEALFGSPPSQWKAESIIPSGIASTQLAEASEKTVLLPWISLIGRRVDRRLGAVLLGLVLLAIIFVIPLAINGISLGSVSTAAATATPTIFATMTSTHTPMVTRFPAAISTAGLTSRPPTRQPVQTPDERNADNYVIFVEPPTPDGFGGWIRNDGLPHSSLPISDPVGSFADWHTYVTDWWPGHARWLIDGAEVESTTTNVPDSGTYANFYAHDVSMTVDWVKARLRASQEPSVTLGVAEESGLFSVGGTPGWGYRHGLFIDNDAADELPAGYSVRLVLDTESLVNDGKLLEDGDDLRVVWETGSTLVELDRVAETPFNSDSTEVWFKTQAPIPGNGRGSNYSIYYGNPSAGAPPADPVNVYALWDDFDGDALDLSRWYVTAGSANVGGGQAQLPIGTNLIGITPYTHTLLEMRLQLGGQDSWGWWGWEDRPAGLLYLPAPPSPTPTATATPTRRVVIPTPTSTPVPPTDTPPPPPPQPAPTQVLPTESPPTALPPPLPTEPPPPPTEEPPRPTPGSTEQG
jgi:serine/threonine protein kinase